MKTVTVDVEKGHTHRTEYQFNELFRIGNDSSCEIRIFDDAINPFHAAVYPYQQKWWIKDLGSRSGTYLNGRSIQNEPLPIPATLELGRGGPTLAITGEKSETILTPKKEEPGLDHYLKHYFTESEDDTAGDHTRMVRQAFSVVKKRQRKKSFGIIALITLLFLAAVGYGVHKHFEVLKHRALAKEIFYEMKSMELEYAKLLKSARFRMDRKSRELVENYWARQEKLEKSYEKFTDALGVYGEDTPPEDRAILRVVRIFGECEIDIPDRFLREVKRYIAEWGATDRMKKAIARAADKGYTQYIIETLLKYDLPPHFFYLALQESNFDVNACGPWTRWGIAKGMWQFIPSTARNYGLRIGPMAESRRPDPLDERHHFEKATRAAARYIREIYESKAQGSGLLTVVSYNWGENRVRRLVAQLPKNPRDRNFWAFFNAYGDDLPRQTYHYVFSIFSAAVIGEAPELFGFPFDNPLAVPLDRLGASEHLEEGWGADIPEEKEEEMKTIWLTSLGKSEETVKTLMTDMKPHGIKIDGHFWQDDLEKVAWMNGREELLDENVALWAILGSRDDFQSPSLRYGLSLLALSVQAQRGVRFPILILQSGGGDPVSPDALPTPLNGAEVLKTPGAALPAKLVARVHKKIPLEMPEYHLDAYGDDQIGQWFELGPREGTWRGAVFGVAGAEIAFHAVGARGKLPERSVLNFPQKGLKIELGGEEYTAWAVQNELGPESSYFVKVTGFPASVLFSDYSPDVEMEMFVVRLK